MPQKVLAATVVLVGCSREPEQTAHSKPTAQSARIPMYLTPGA